MNLPARHKMTAPKYQELARAGMGNHALPDNGGRFEVIAGEFQGTKGPASTFTPVQVYNAHLKGGAEVTLPLPQAYNTAVLVVEGSVTVNGTAAAAADHFVLFANDGDAITLRAKEDSVVLVLSGEPIDEPIASYGPFVMNTHEEIVQAIEDFNQGKFGNLE
jgi:redox-sensitive bicupin YhaK (pirin superfamily)